uniref:Uncharacterized protein n=1 Tax=Anguilla anguilla TaxID=7936 RepID=A0A0E9SZK3_ANGAN
MKPRDEIHKHLASLLISFSNLEFHGEK